MIISIVLFLLFLSPSVFLFSFYLLFVIICCSFAKVSSRVVMLASHSNSTPFVIFSPVIFGSAIFGTLGDH